MILETLNQQIQKHSYYTSKINPKFNRAIDQAALALAEVYAAVGVDDKNEKKNKIKLRSDKA